MGGMISTSGVHHYKGVSCELAQEVFRDIQQRTFLENGPVITIQWVRKSSETANIGDSWIERRHSNGNCAVMRKSVILMEEATAERPFSMRTTIEFMRTQEYPRNPQFDGTMSITIEKDPDDTNNCILRWYNAFVPTGPVAYLMTNLFPKRCRKQCTTEIEDEFRGFYVHCLKRAVYQEGDAKKVEELRLLIQQEVSKPFINKSRQTGRNSIKKSEIDASALQNAIQEQAKPIQAQQQAKPTLGIRNKTESTLLVNP